MKLQFLINKVPPPRSLVLENMSDTDNKMLSKNLLRKEMQSILKNLTKDEINRQSKLVTNKVINHEAFQKAKSVSIYLSMNDEIQTEELLSHIFEQGKDCFIPRFQAGSSEMEMIRLSSFEHYLNLPRNKWNIPQPPDDEVLESVFDRDELNLVLTPGLAFTVDGKRLGRGKGYYDKFFSKCEKSFKKSPIKIGIAFNEQIVPSIPVTENDVKLDFVVTANS